MNPPYPVGTLCYLVGSTPPCDPPANGKVATIRGHGVAPRELQRACAARGGPCNCRVNRTTCWLTNTTTTFCVSAWSALRPIAPPPQLQPAPPQEAEA